MSDVFWPKLDTEFRWVLALSRRNSSPAQMSKAREIRPFAPTGISTEHMQFLSRDDRDYLRRANLLVTLQSRTRTCSTPRTEDEIATTRIVRKLGNYLSTLRVR